MSMSEDLLQRMRMDAARLRQTETKESLQISGGLPVFPSLTAGSVLFVGASGILAQDNTNLFWDDTNNRLGINTNAPAALPLCVDGGIRNRQAGSTRYRSDWSVGSAAAGINAFDDTGAVYIPINIDGNNVVFNQSSGGSVGVPASTGSAQFALDSTLTPSTSTITIANNATATPLGNANNFSGLLIVNDTSVTGSACVFIIGAAIVKIAESSGANFTTTLNNAGTINVYLAAGVVTIQNKNGSSIVFRVMAFRTRTSA